MGSWDPGIHVSMSYIMWSWDHGIMGCGILGSWHPWHHVSMSHPSIHGICMVRMVSIPCISCNEGIGALLMRRISGIHASMDPGIMAYTMIYSIWVWWHPGDVEDMYPLSPHPEDDDIPYILNFALMIACRLHAIRRMLPPMLLPCV